MSQRGDGGKVVKGTDDISRAHLQDFDFLAKKDLGLGQVFLINAFDGHLPVSLL